MSGHGNSSLMSFMNNGTNKFYIDNTNVNSGSFIGIGNYISSLNALVVFAGCKTAEGRSNMKLFLNGGGSGAVIFSKDINIISEMDKNDVNLIDTKGFDMINGYSIFPHYTNKKSKLSKEENTQRHEKITKSIIEFSKSLGKVYALPEEDTMIYCDGNLEIIGTLPYYICENGIITKYDVVSRKALIK